MRLSTKGLLEIAEHEGVVPAPYLDSVGVWTFGVGHTAAAGGPNPEAMTRGMPTDVEFAVDQALRLFGEDVRKYEARVNKMLGGLVLEQHQFDALVSWDFNTGGALWRSKSGKPAQLVRQILSGDLSGDGFMGWLRPPEIKKRRKAEMMLFRTGDYDANGRNIPVWRVDKAGRLRGILYTMDGADVLRRIGASAGPTQRPSGGPSGLKWLLKILGVIGR